MPLYLWSATYTAEGNKGLLREGGSKRRDAVQQMMSNAGGKLHAFYYAFSDADVYGIAEFPDATSAAAASIAVNASGAVTLRSVPLMTPEEVDAAAKKSVGYRAPGT